MAIFPKTLGHMWRHYCSAAIRLVDGIQKERRAANELPASGAHPLPVEK